MEVPPIQFAPARGGRIAYQRFGTGPEVVIGIPPAAQNIEVAWEWPGLRTMFDRFGRFCDYLHFDKRGTGASDVAQTVPGIDERVDDLRAVLDAEAIERAHLFAQSEGGPLALLFAASYPERAKSITLMGSCARVMPDEYDRDRQSALRERFAELWGTDESMAVPVFAPGHIDDDEFVRWHRRYERVAASSQGVRDLMMQMMDWDVRDVVPDVECPILVLHRRDDPAMPLELGREVAALAPEATLVELDGGDHFAFLGDQSWLDEMERFVTGSVREHPTQPSAPPSVELITLGRFAVVVDGEEVPTSAWGSKRARTLVKRLAAARGWPVRRDELADILWPDEADPSVWGSRLSVVLSTARRVLRGGIHADRQTVALDLDSVDLDLARLHDASDDTTILDLHAGPFLAEEATEDWRRGAHDEALSIARQAGHRLLNRALDAPVPAEATRVAHLLLAWDEGDAIAHDAAVEAARLAGDPAAEAAARARRGAAFGCT
ncbi:MAG: alpha/beta fold hydrolase [Actinomycetota bacterium]